MVPQTWSRNVLSPLCLSREEGDEKGNHILGLFQKTKKEQMRITSTDGEKREVVPLSVKEKSFIEFKIVCAGIHACETGFVPASKHVFTVGCERLCGSKALMV